MLFRRLIEENIGITIGPEKAYLIETRLSGLLKQLKLGSFHQLYFAAKSDRSGELLPRIADAITTNETFWFRDGLPWRYLEQNRMEGYLSELRSGKRDRVRIWSAASSTGQEAYSTAMMIDRYLSSRGITDIPLSRFEILATDISQAVLDTARKGKFDSIAAARGLDDFWREKYFQKDGSAYELNERIRKTVLFREFNLQNSFFPLGMFDVIFLRYVMIYFSERLREEIARKMRSSLKDGGVLFLGSSELYPCISANFTAAYFGRGICYTKESKA